MKQGKRNIAASVHQRLLNIARESGRPFNELLQYFAIERFIYRLSKSPHAENFILKGALMFKVWNAPISRPTKDIDLLGKTKNDIDSVISIMREACIQEVEPDGMTFDPESVTATTIIEDADYEGVRVHIQGYLGKGRVPIQIDIGFGDDVAMFSFTSRPLARALVRAAQRGVRVRVVLDDGQAKSKYSKYRFLVNKGIPVKLDNRSAYMHHKFAVIDHKMVITGSYNWTASAKKRNDENLVVLRDPEFVRAL